VFAKGWPDKIKCVIESDEWTHRHTQGLGKELSFYGSLVKESLFFVICYLFICGLFNDTVSSLGYSTENELNKTCKEAIVEYYSGICVGLLRKTTNLLVSIASLRAEI
jgi:hypothetical protein